MPDLFENAPTDAELAELAGLDAPSELWPSVLAEYIDVLRACFRRRGRTDDEALEEAQHAVIALGQYCGGRQSYLPTGDRLMTAVRDRRLYLEYCGPRNKGDLARRYGITERRVEQIAAEQKAVHVRRMQGRLFVD
ncbi:MAG: Mor transcription activator family protein [Rhodanobacter sp.]